MFQEPLQVFGHEKIVVRISAGYNHSCAITGLCLFMHAIVIQANNYKP